MRPFLIREIANGVHGLSHGKGLLVALRAYFDDTGTHDSSPIVMWGGLIGDETQWDALEAGWMKPLRARGLSSFHMSHCEAGEGPYGNRAARDRLTFELRQVILESRLFKLAGAVPVPDWNELVVGEARIALGDAEDASLHYAIMAAMDHAQSAPIGLFFDRRQKKMTAIEALVERYNRALGRLDAVTFLSAESSPAIQATDMVAWEMRHHLLQSAAAGKKVDPRPHFASLVRQGGMMGGILSRQHIVEMLEDWAKGPPDDGVQRVIASPKRA